jgi:hypothetical protein
MPTTTTPPKPVTQRPAPQNTEKAEARRALQTSMDRRQ